MFNLTKILEYIDEQDWITLGLESVLILYLTILWVIFLSAIIYAIYLFSVLRADKKLLQNHSYVTILKPCYGLNPNLEHNLESFFLLDYPKSKYEIRFCISNPSDQAVDVCQKLKEKYLTKVKCSIHVDNTDVGINPKINNMFSAWKKAVDNKSEFIFISDSNNYILPETLLSLVNRASEHPDSAFVHGMPFCKPRSKKSFGELVEQIYFSTQHARHYLFWNLTDQPCTNGQSTLVNVKNFKQAIGCISDLGNYIAEDYFMGLRCHQAGFKTPLATYPILQNGDFSCTENGSFNRYLERMVRWTKLRMTMIPGTSILEPFTECLLSGLIQALIATYLYFQNHPITFIYLFLMHILVWFAFDTVLQACIDDQIFKNDNLFRIFLAWFVREIFSLYITFKSIINLTDITWGGKKFTVTQGGDGHDRDSRSESAALVN